MIFRIALLRAVSRCQNLTPEQQALARRAALRPRYRQGDEVLRLDHLAEEQAIASVQADNPGLLASALPTALAGDVATAYPDSLVGKIDWAKLLDWLVQNLPKIIEIIMSLIALFSPQPGAAEEQA